MPIIVSRRPMRPFMPAQRRVAAVLVPHPGRSFLRRPGSLVQVHVSIRYVITVTGGLTIEQHGKVLGLIGDLADENEALSEENKHFERQLHAEVVRRLMLERQLIAAMRRAGVTDARSFLEYIKVTANLDHKSNTAAWKILLKANPGLVECMRTEIPSWSRLIEDNEEAATGVLAANMAALHSNLSNSLHTFDIPYGLTIYEGKPDIVTAQALKCIALNFNVPCTLVPAEVVQEMLSRGTDARGQPLVKVDVAVGTDVAGGTSTVDAASSTSTVDAAGNMGKVGAAGRRKKGGGRGKPPVRS